MKVSKKDKESYNKRKTERKYKLKQERGRNEVAWIEAFKPVEGMKSYGIK